MMANQPNDGIGKPVGRPAMLGIAMLGCALAMSAVGCVYPSATAYSPPGFSSTYQRYSLAAYQARMQGLAQNSPNRSGGVGVPSAQVSSAAESAPENVRRTSATR